ncbi:MAG: phosphoribosylformylglycinamidine synthase subunit PurL [Thermoplasmatota archaeon]
MSSLQKYLRVRSRDPLVHEVEILKASDSDLVEISGASRVGLDLAEMRAVQAHFQKLNRNPTDVELEALGQAWSEHCCYKSSKPVLKRHVYGIHEEKLVAREDAGVMAFDAKHDYVVKIESHNHPSAIEPYGGAATGIGGVLRDVVCMGAQPIALVDPLFFGPLDIAPKDVPAGTKHPRYLFSGVVAGIRDYGNRVGIPTIAGSVTFHPKFLTNCLVNVGCLGIMAKEDLIHSSVGGVGDLYILMGGRTGRDGIHGVTFASTDLTRESESVSRSAVQLGDAITKEPLIHACLEANSKKLLTGMKDLGGGGLSCVCGEMARDGGLGAEVWLEKIPLKAPDMVPWEIWVSESQERMMVTVRPENIEAVLAIARKWDVTAAVVGVAIPDRKVRVKWNEAVVFEMDSEFLYEGPVYERPQVAPKVLPSQTPPTLPASPDAWNQALLALLSSPNIASRELVIRQYDHEVRGNTVIRPLQGAIGYAAHGDASVLKPVPESWKGLAVSTDATPHLTEIDPYWGSATAMEETLRNLTSVGARIDCIADNLNCPNPQRPERMGEIEEATRALGDAARALGIPFVSGNVSMYNESPTTPIPATPTIMGVGIVEDIRTCVTTDLKKEGASLFQVGNTKDEMAGSEWYRIANGRSTIVPKVDWPASIRTADTLREAITKGWVAACHDVAQGGLAVAVAEMAFGGNIGATIDVMGSATGLRDDVLLFGESNTRWVVESRDDERLIAHFRAAGIPLHRLGTVGGRSIIAKSQGQPRVDVDLEEARAAWRDALGKFVAG